jgi:hypothetical protein
MHVSERTRRPNAEILAAATDTSRLNLPAVRAPKTQPATHRNGTMSAYRNHNQNDIYKYYTIFAAAALVVLCGDGLSFLRLMFCAANVFRSEIYPV